MKLHILKVPYDSGQRCERMARGPGYLLSKQVLREYAPVVEAVETTLPFSSEIATAFDLCRQVAARVRAITSEREFPVVLSGNCMIAVGTISGLGSQDTGVLWFDGHGEFNTPETTASGFLDGMPLAVLLGNCWSRMSATIPGFSNVPAEHVILAGARDMDPDERSAIERSGIVQAQNLTGFKAALDRLAARVRRLYIHLDLDVLDATEAVSNQWVTPGGMQVAEVAEIIRYAGGLIPLGAVGLASLDPACDSDGRALEAAGKLLDTAISEAAR